ncbi:DUF2207 domain-containing protein [Rhodanobacter sp. AS-Z3]|uniref:DUF2207 domain-containing protein n=1 Tax=Rhodanobacter sp. AS-Z3 TaxID=3031330 RepID=UPI002479C28A|nr:DUF2207 domain-containing protein [Rhodanobacter sp. AS-Z3]WEN15149.1 DUF2207 domain-containing protein [Rhodanobacter sp. AS-Z3]
MRQGYGSFLLLALAIFALAGTCRADERILDYHADIVLAADGSMNVTEHIRVQAEGNQIRHGIYRDFPTDYRDPLHNRYRVQFKLISTERDGRSEPSHTQPQANGIRIYLGDSNSVVDPGEHEYTLHYQSNRQIGFFKDHDELFWNVTGTGWDFPIDHASAHITLPVAVEPGQLKATGYTGSQGSLEHSLTSQLDADGASFASTRGLQTHEGLSIALSFPKGLIAEPDKAQRFRWLLGDNRNLLFGLLGLALLWLYYGLAWVACGRDPATGVRVAAYEPPDGDSAAALRYVRRMGYDNTCFTAAILGIAAKGGLQIERNAAGRYSVTRSQAVPDNLAADEKVLLDTLLPDTQKLTFESSQHQRVSAAQNALKKALSSGWRKKFFATHSLLLLPGVVISLVTLFLIVGDNVGPAAFMLLWLTVWSFGVAGLFQQAWQASHTGGKGAAGLWFMTVIFGAGEVAGLTMLGSTIGYANLPIFLALIGTNIAFHHWMKAPTQIGAKLLDRIEGFRWYLGVAEKQELDSRYQPESRPELFAAYLPYALALDVGNAWAQRFTDALSTAQLKQAQPSWYSGAGVGSFDSSSFANFGNGLAAGVGSAIASSSVAPGSSSGFGGSSGGSGGGGGGGGGGGW